MSSAPTVEAVDAAGFAPWVEAAASIYGAAMHRPPATIASRRELIGSHLDRTGFAAVTAIADGKLVGFGYGYRAGPGQWWHDVVAAALGRDNAGRWLANAFELAELHVDPDWQGNGLGRSVIELLLGRVTAATVVLSAIDELSPARRLYGSLGFTDLLTAFRFPGSAELYAIMGLRRDGR